MSSLSLGVRVGSDMEPVRKLEDICQNLTLPTEQGKVVEFLTNPENAQRINDLVEDIYEVLMGYQVCILNVIFLPPLTIIPDFIGTGRPQ